MGDDCAGVDGLHGSLFKRKGKINEYEYKEQKLIQNSTPKIFRSSSRFGAVSCE